MTFAAHLCLLAAALSAVCSPTATRGSDGRGRSDISAGRRRGLPEASGVLSQAQDLAARQRFDLSAKWPSLLLSSAPPCPATTGRAKSSRQTGERQWVYTSETTRAKLLQVLRKAAAGDEIVVAAIGGSITAGGTLGWRNSYVAVFAELLRQAFPQANVRLELGAKGDSTSVLSAFCFKELVGQQVDLLFIEYTLNDGVDAKKYREPTLSYENLLRRTSALYPSAAIFGVGFWAQYFALGTKFYLLHQRLSQHYGLGWVAVDALAQALIKLRLMTRKSITADAKGHPTQVVYAMIGQLTFVSLIEQTACQPETSYQNLQHPVAQTALPPPRNPALLREGHPNEAFCDFVGLPKANSTTAGLHGTSVLKGWRYVSIRWAGPEQPRRDMKLQLIPGIDIRRAMGALHSDHPMIDKTSSQPGKDSLVVSVNVESRIIISVCQEGNYVARYNSKCQPFRLFLQPSQQEILVKPWLKRNYGLFQSVTSLSSGTQNIRIDVSQGGCKPYTCLGAVIGL